MTSNIKEKIPTVKHVSTLELFERYVKLCDITNSYRHDPVGFHATEERKRNLEKLIRDRVLFAGILR